MSIKINKTIDVRGGRRAYVDCSICGKEFVIPAKRAEKALESISCSRECYKIYMRDTASKRVISGFLKNNRNMRSGCGITTDGYVWIYIKGKRANQIKLHRYLMEIKIGRPLRADEIVHHIDGNKLNNSIDNLEITSISEHNRKHGNLTAKNRDDCFSEQELIDINKLPPKDFVKKYPRRTLGACYQQRNRLKKLSLGR